MHKKVADALCFAADAHKRQRRKADDSPYIIHPLRVVQNLVVCEYSDPDLLCAAVLHDVVEDTDVTLDEIEKRFGPAVASVVAEVTDDKTLTKAERKRKQIEKVRYGSVNMQRIKIADKIDNCRDLLKQPPPGWSDERVRGYIVWSNAVVNAVPYEHAPKLHAMFSEVYDDSGAPSDPDTQETLLSAYYASMQ